MSAGRRFRRHLTANRVQWRLEAAEHAAPQIVFLSGTGDGTGLQPIVVAGVVYLVPCPPAGAEQELLEAFSIRATATLTGRCDGCGARRHVTGRLRPGHVGDMTMTHEPGCPASDPMIGELMCAGGYWAC